MNVTGLRLGNIQIPPGTGNQSQIQLLPANEQQAGGAITISGTRETILAVLVELGNAVTVNLSLTAGQ